MTSIRRLRVYQLGMLILLCVCAAQTVFIRNFILNRDGPKPLVVINDSDDFTSQISRAFDLPTVIQRYDQVINAIEQYHQEQGEYPASLDVLVPAYLPVNPDISIRNGERIKYSPDKKNALAPFRFYIYGHYTGKASMHEWFLKYCPAEFGLCNEVTDQETYPLRLNKRWIWISSLTL